MTTLVRRIVRWITGVVLVLLGAVLTLPGVPGPGLLVVLLGVLVLLPESRWLRKRYVRVKRRHPRLFQPLEGRRRRQREARRRRAAGSG